MQNFFTFTILMHFLATSIGESGPNVETLFSSSPKICLLGPCRCAQNMLICSCNDNIYGEQQIDLNATLLEGQKKFRSIFFHHCKKLTVASKTFAGISVTDQIKFSDIGFVRLHSHSFQDIQRPIKQIVFQNSNLELLESFTFTGLSHVQHFWWRNVSIGHVEKMAFAKISNIEYLYFREAKIDKVHSEAFASMRHIDHVYFRGSVKINKVERYPFLGSKFKELFLEDVKIKFGDLDLTGLVANTVRISNSTWNEGKKSHASRHPTNSHQRKSINEIHIQHTSIPKFSTNFFLNISKVLFEDSHIRHLHGSGSMKEQKHTHWPKSIKFVKTKIDKIHSLTLRSIRAQIIEFLNCVIEQICTGAIHTSTITSLNFIGGKIGRLNSGSLSANHLKDVKFKGIKIHRIDPRAFVNSNIATSLSFEHSHIERIEDEAFFGVNAESLKMKNCLLGQLEAHAFKNLNVSSLDIVGSTFESPIEPSMFRNVGRDMRIAFTGCKIVCKPDECELNAMFLNPSSHNNILWRFSDNHCQSLKINNSGQTAGSLFPRSADRSEVSEEPLLDDNRKEVCIQEKARRFYGGKIHCRRRALIEECVCLPLKKDLLMKHNDETDELQIPSSAASIFLMGDCQLDQLVLDMRNQKQSSTSTNPDDFGQFKEDSFSLPQSMYFYRLEGIRICSVSSNVQKMHIFHSKVTIDVPGAFYGANIQEFILQNSYIELIDRNSFSGGFINRLILNDTKFYNEDDFYALTDNPNIQEVIIYPYESIFNSAHSIYTVVENIGAAPEDSIIHSPVEKNIRLENINCSAEDDFCDSSKSSSSFPFLKCPLTNIYIVIIYPLIFLLSLINF